MSLLTEGGLEAVTLQRVAAKLDVVPGTLYRYFGSKDELLAAMQRRTIDDLHTSFVAIKSRWQAAAAACEGPDGTREVFEILAVSRFYLSVPRFAPERYRLVSALLADPRPVVPDEEARRAGPPLLAFLREVADLFGAASAAKALDAGDALERTLALWSGLHGSLQLNKLARFDDDRVARERLGLVLARTLLLGWGACPAALDAATRALDALDVATGLFTP